MIATSDLYNRVSAYSQRPLHQPDRDLIMLEGGEPHFATPLPVIEAMDAALREGWTHYPAGAGDRELRTALAAEVGKAAGVDWVPDGIYVTHGASAACNAAIMALVNPGDRVVLPEPTYSLHVDQVLAAGAVPVFVGPGEGFHLDLDALRDASRAARMILLTNPTNPTGIVYTRDELEGVADIAVENDLIVLSDEVYHRHVYDGFDYVSALSVPRLRDRLIYVQTFGKSYAMTGWRIGYMAGPPALIAACRTVHRTLAGSVNSAVQRAALATLDLPASVLEEMRLSYQSNRDIVQSLLSGIPGVSIQLPQAALYSFVRVDLGRTSQEILLAAAEVGVTIRSGREYGPSGEGYVRVAFCVPPQTLSEGCERLAGLFRSWS